MNPFALLQLDHLRGQFLPALFDQIVGAHQD